jgi:hypothetical protein
MANKTKEKASGKAGEDWVKSTVLAETPEMYSDHEYSTTMLIRRTNSVGHASYVVQIERVVASDATQEPIVGTRECQSLTEALQEFGEHVRYDDRTHALREAIEFDGQLPPYKAEEMLTDEEWNRRHAARERRLARTKAARERRGKETPDGEPPF